MKRTQKNFTENRLATTVREISYTKEEMMIQYDVIEIRKMMEKLVIKVEVDAKCSTSPKQKMT